MQPRLRLGVRLAAPRSINAFIPSSVLQSLSQSRSITTATTGQSSPSDPLRILFCGSDAFSIASLDALVHAKQHVPGLIDEIHVAHRPAKPTGRGMKTMREVPISTHARTLSLPTHPLDTFTAWTPPTTYSLIIAVSFGLFIPPRILSSAQHGGLNVHPSLLPDLRGSAPIAHALLKQYTHTGVSVQTLHPEKFDAGVVLAQSAAPGEEIRAGETAEELEARLAVVGAEMLVDVLKEGRFRAPLEGRGWYAGPTAWAPKVTKADREVDFRRMGLAGVLAVQRALGDMWTVLPNGERVVVHEVAAVEGEVEGREGMGLWYDEARKEVLFRAACGRVGVVKATTYPGGKAGKGNAKVAKILREQAKL